MKHKRNWIVVVLVVSAGLAVFGYRKWKEREEFLEVVRASAVSMQKRTLEQALGPQLNFIPEHRQTVLLAILASAKAEVLEEVPVNETEKMVRFRLSVLSEAGARDLADRFLKSHNEKKILGADEIAEVIQNQVDKSIPRQIVVGELRMAKNEHHWILSSAPTP
nr:hypothetical protein CKG001_12030 [Bdellovibrio sp. CKG001]